MILRMESNTRLMEARPLQEIDAIDHGNINLDSLQTTMAVFDAIIRTKDRFGIKVQKVNKGDAEIVSLADGSARVCQSNPLRVNRSASVHRRRVSAWLIRKKFAAVDFTAS